MNASASVLPRRKADLILGPPDLEGRQVVKDLGTESYYQLGPEESFLLGRLDGRFTSLEIREAFQERFGDPLSEADFEGFLDLAREQGFLDESEDQSDTTADPLRQRLLAWPILGERKETKKAKAKKAFDPLNIKIHLYDPSKFFEWIYPSIRFVWTKSFVALLFVFAAFAGVVIWENQSEFAKQIPSDWGWKTILLGWLVLAFVTTWHEFAHGLTCKHFGGEVHDVGFLMLLVLPSLYCNVSDAWLLPERWKRLAVTFAGSGCDLMFWTLGVLVWRVTVPDSFINLASWYVVTVCGVRLLLNMNPLIKLDGYYLAVDILGIPNLRQRSLDRFKSTVRWSFWGASRPAVEEKQKTLAVFGVATWVFSIGFLALVFWGFIWYVGAIWGLLPVLACGLLAVLLSWGLFQGLSQGEVSAMLKHRPGRASAWVILGTSSVIGVSAYPIEDRAGGEFHIRPTSKIVLRSPVAGFLREVAAGEGGKVSPGQLVARLEVPDLVSRVAQKGAEIEESKARLKLLKAGARPEEIFEKKQAVQRAKGSCERSRHELDRAKIALKEELVGLDEQIRSATAERDRANEMLRRDKYLIARNALESDSLRDSQKAFRVSSAQLAQANAKKRGREAEGTLKSEAELASRQSLLAGLEGELRVLAAGNRPEEIDAEASRLSRLEEEYRYLQRVSGRLNVLSTLQGVITTPRLEERVGRFFQEGEVIAEVEGGSPFEAEILLKEYDVVRVRKGMPVNLKVRALPFEVLVSSVDRVGIASSSTTASQSTATTTTEAATATASATDKTCSFIVYCKLDEKTVPELKTGMTGYGRVTVGKKPIVQVLGLRAYRMIRNEFWW